METDGTQQAVAATTKSKRSGWRRLVRRVLGVIALAVGITVAIPLVLVPVYGVVNPVSVPMLYRYMTGHPVDRVWRDIDEISDRLKVAVMMSEDGQFCRHRGVDLGALRVEVETYLAGGDARGASTITMQVARNLFLINDRSVIRKALEVPLALYIDLVLPKRRIMEIYLNIAQWGPVGEFGVEAATVRAYGSAATALTWERASMIAVLLPNPRLRDPNNPSPGLRRIAGLIENRAKQFWNRADCLYDGPMPAVH